MKKILFLLVACALSITSVIGAEKSEATEAYATESRVYTDSNGLSFQFVNIEINQHNTLLGYDVSIKNGSSKLASINLLQEFWKRPGMQEEFFNYSVNLAGGQSHIWQVFRFGIPIYDNDSPYLVLKIEYTLQGSSTVHTGYFVHDL